MAPHTLKGRELEKVSLAVIRASHAAGEKLLKYYGHKITVREKENSSSLVTNADLEAEGAALKILKRARPDFEILSEESAPNTGAAPARFIIDPLDGTTNFIHRFPMFCVSIAAEFRGKLVVGVVYHPVLDETYLAIRGGGATLNKVPIRVSQTRQLRDSLLTTGFTYRKDRWLHEEMLAFERLSAVARAVRRPGSAALDLAYTARGVFDGFWERRLSPWDVAAGVLLVQEAGGKVSNFTQKAFSVHDREIIATNRTLHRPLFDAITRPR